MIEHPIGPVTGAYAAWRAALIGRLARLLSPRHILLAGARDEALARTLMEAATGCRATLHVAERAPPAWLTALQAAAGDCLMIHAAASVEAAGVLPVPELAWIDEDPDRATVHGVLQAILAQASRLGKPFPPTLVSNAGRPAGFRARAEGGPGHGVLTAIEDLVAGHQAGLCVTHLPGFGGLAAITPAAGQGADAFSPANVIADLTALAVALEEARLLGKVALPAAEGSGKPVRPAAALVPVEYEGEPASDAEMADLLRLRASPLFDTAWYLAKNADVSVSRADPALHYLRHGAAERRDPNPFFSGGYYLDAYADVAGAKLNPVLHYLADGAAEGRNPGPRFATRLYTDAHPEVLAAGVNALEHFLTVGLRNGWRAPAVP